MDEISSFDEFLVTISMNEQEINLIQESTSEQAGSEIWFQYRTNRITASKFKDAVQKINDNMTVKNPDKSRTFISKVCRYYPKFESKATQWGITNEPIARKNYTTQNKSKHKKFKVVGLHRGLAFLSIWKTNLSVQAQMV